MYCFAIICRLCTTNSKVYSSLYNCDENDVKLLDKLLTFLPDLYRPNDNLPVHICTSCHERLSQAYDFREQCLYFYKKLTRYLVQIQDITGNEVLSPGKANVSICNTSNITNIKSEYVSNITNIKSVTESTVTNIKSESEELKSFQNEKLGIIENNTKILQNDNSIYRQFNNDIQNDDNRNFIMDKLFRSEIKTEFVSEQNHTISLNEINSSTQIECDLEHKPNIGNNNGVITNIDIIENNIKILQNDNSIYRQFTNDIQIDDKWNSFMDKSFKSEIKKECVSEQNYTISNESVTNNPETNNCIKDNILNDYDSDFNMKIGRDYSEIENKILNAFPSKDQNSSTNTSAFTLQHNQKSMYNKLIEKNKMVTNENQKQKRVLKYRGNRLDEVAGKKVKRISAESGVIRSDHDNDENTARNDKKMMNNDEVQTMLNTTKYITKRDENEIGNDDKSEKHIKITIIERKENGISYVNDQIQNIFDNGNKNCAEDENIFHDIEFDDTDHDSDFIMEMDSDSSEGKYEEISTNTKRRSTRSMGITASPSKNLENSTNITGSTTLQNKLISINSKMFNGNKMVANENQEQKNVLKYINTGILGDDVATGMTATLVSMDRSDINKNAATYRKEMTNDDEAMTGVNIKSEENVHRNENIKKLPKVGNEGRIENGCPTPKKDGSNEFNNDNEIKVRNQLEEARQLQKEIENEKTDTVSSDLDKGSSKTINDKNSQIAILVGALSNPDDPTEFIYQHPIDPETKIIFICDRSNSVYSCKFCQKNFREFSALSKHMMRHTGLAKYSCNICGQKAFTKAIFERHMETHSAHKQVPCKTCGKTYKNEKLLGLHMLWHTRRNKFMCDICGKGFPFSFALTGHKVSHSAERNFVCTECGASFKTNRSLKRHSVVHRTEKKFQCEVCQAKFLSAERLRDHALKHDDNNRKFKCTVCDKSFLRKKSFLVHVKIHTGETPFICKTCGKGFRQQDWYENHIRIHTGIKPFGCEVCKKGFVQQASLVVHMRIHTGEKPYKCNDCGKSYTQSYVYKQHVKKHHPK